MSYSKPVKFYIRKDELVALNDLTGKRFGRWVVLGRAPNRKKATMWHCRCDCGNEQSVLAAHLVRGESTNCGCIRSAAASAAITTHGKHGTRLYAVWKNMRCRCNLKTSPAYKYYGAKGVKICTEWDNFENFWNWSIANGYDKDAPHGKCTIDRIDVYGNYCPENCRWVDMKAQSLNKRNSKKENQL